MEIEHYIVYVKKSSMKKILKNVPVNVRFMLFTFVKNIIANVWLN